MTKNTAADAQPECEVPEIPAPPAIPPMEHVPPAPSSTPRRKKKTKVMETVIDHTYRDYSNVEVSWDEDEELDGKGKKVAPNFPAKLHAIVSNPNYQHIICWQPHGRSWKVVDKHAFSTVICPRHFAHAKFESFNRSVNGWGFKRLLSEGPDYKSYYHECFLRGRPELTKIMNRLTNPGKRLPDKAGEPDFYSISRKFPLPPLASLPPMMTPASPSVNKQYAAGVQTPYAGLPQAGQEQGMLSPPYGYGYPPQPYPPQSPLQAQMPPGQYPHPMAYWQQQAQQQQQPPQFQQANPMMPSPYGYHPYPHPMMMMPQHGMQQPGMQQPGMQQYGMQQYGMQPNSPPGYPVAQAYNDPYFQGMPPSAVGGAVPDGQGMVLNVGQKHMRKLEAAGVVPNVGQKKTKHEAAVSLAAKVQPAEPPQVKGSAQDSQKSPKSNGEKPAAAVLVCQIDDSTKSTAKKPDEKSAAEPALSKVVTGDPKAQSTVKTIDDAADKSAAGDKDDVKPDSKGEEGDKEKHVVEV